MDISVSVLIVPRSMSVLQTYSKPGLDPYVETNKHIIRKYHEGHFSLTRLQSPHERSELVEQQYNNSEAIYT